MTLRKGRPNNNKSVAISPTTRTLVPFGPTSPSSITTVSFHRRARRRSRHSSPICISHRSRKFVFNSFGPPLRACAHRTSPWIRKLATHGQHSCSDRPFLLNMSEAEAEAQQTQAEVKAEDGNAPINVKVRFFLLFYALAYRRCADFDYCCFDPHLGRDVLALPS